MALDRKKLGISRQVSRACILEFSGAGQVPGPGRIQYTQFFRAQAGSYSEAYTACSKSLDPGRISILKKSEPRSGSWSLAYTVYSNFSGQGRLPIWSVYKKLEKSGLGQNLYTQKFRVWSGSWSGAYTESSKSLGRICILKFSGPEQAPDLERKQKARKVRAWADLYTQIFRVWSGSWSGAYTESLESRAWAESVYSKIQCPDRFLVRGVYRKLEEPGLGRICILKNSVPGQVPGLERIQKARKARAQGRISILKFSGLWQAPD